MKIAIDSRWIGQHGIGRFAYEISKRLNLPNARIGLTPYSPLDVLVTTAWLLFNLRLSLFSPGYNAPLFFLGRYSFVVHDLNHIDLPYNSSLLKRIYYRFVLKRACQNARNLFTVSNFTAERISQWAQIPLADIAVVGNGVSDVFSEKGPRHRESAPYFLVVGNRKRHKNELQALKAFALLKQRDECFLLFVGPSSMEISNLSERLGMQSRVRFVQDLSEEDLASYYRGAVALVFPSLYEGFGLPIVEAMACGCPVISSNVTAMPEICGDAALLVDPMSEATMMSAMAKILLEDGCARELKERGLLNARRFRWDDVAAKVKFQLERES